MGHSFGFVASVGDGCVDFRFTSNIGGYISLSSEIGVVFSFRKLKDLPQMFKVELYVSFKNSGLNDRIVIVGDGHVGVKERDRICIDDFKNIKKGLRP